MRLGKLNDALGNTRRAIAIDRDLIAADPKRTVLRSNMAIYRVAEAEILRRMRDEAAALRGYKEARSLYDQSAQSDQHNSDARLNVAAADAKIAATLVRLGQYDEARKSYWRPIQASEQPTT
jgi:tetratricopeptide (TPR) repeat protein